MVRGLMSKCAKCGRIDIKKEPGRLEGATIGASRLFFDVYIYTTAAIANYTFKKKPTYTWDISPPV